MLCRSACLQVNQAMNQVIASTVPLPIPSALNLPMGASLDINAQTRAGVSGRGRPWQS
jgi:hypothetical protein